MTAMFLQICCNDYRKIAASGKHQQTFILVSSK